MIFGTKMLNLQDDIFSDKQTILSIEENTGDQIQYNNMPIDNLLNIIRNSDDKIDSIKSTQLNSPNIVRTEENIPDEKGSKIEVNGQSHENNVETNTLQMMPQKDEEKVEPMKKYTFDIKPDSFINLPSNYSTDEEYEKRIIELINSGYNGWSEVLVEGDVHVYKNDDPEVKPMMVKSYVTINYSKDVLLEAIDNKAIRAQWDPVFSNVELVESFPEKGQEILYVIIKSKVPFASDRDMLQLKTTVKNLPIKNSVLIYVRSVEHPKHPVIRKYVRAKMIIAGYYIEEIEPNKCKVCICNNLNAEISEFIMNKIAPKSVLNWVEKVQNGCKIVLEGKK